MLAMAGFSPSLLVKSSAQDAQTNAGVVASDAPTAVFAANAATLGAIPDSDVAGCQTASTTFKDVTFTVSGLTGTVSTVAVNFNASHTYVQDLEVTLSGPGGAPSHLLFSATGTILTSANACATNGVGDNDLSSANTYTFADTASANWWTTAGANPVPTSTNRTVVTGIGGVPAPPPATTSLNSTFAGVAPNGTWTLRFRDRGSGDLGSVTAANLTITTAAGPVGETIYTTNGSSISRFNSTALGTVTTVPVTGLQAGETLVDMDLRPVNGLLYCVGSTSRLYTVNPLTGAAAQVGTAGAFTLNGTAFGTDFNPVADRIRQVSNTEQNLRLNPNDGSLAATDTALNPAGNVVSVAYDRNDNDPGTSTTLYGIDSAAGTLVMIGGVNGAPSPNGGVVTTVGSLGLGTNLNEAIGFDISTGGTAYASITTGGISRLYTVNGTTGAATLVGAIGSGTTPYVGLAVGTVPLASGVEVSGRVLSPEGRGIRGARVTMSDPSGATRTVMTGPNGAYRFEDVAGGQTYTVWVTARRFTFSPVVIQITDNLADLNFVAEGSGLIDR